MRRSILEAVTVAGAFVCAVAPCRTPLLAASRTGTPAGAVTAAWFGKLPLRFEPNLGQTDGRVKFVSRGAGYTLFLTEREWVLALCAGGGGAEGGEPVVETRAAALRLRLEGARRKVEATGEEELPGRSHYFEGSDPTRWVRDVKSYAKVRYRGVYPGVDLVFYGTDGLLEHDFVVSPGADAGRIRLKVEGAAGLRLDGEGDLLIQTGTGEVVQRRPVIYQRLAGGERREVAGRYRLRGKHEVGFELGTYDRARPLVIDPVLAYSTYLGGSAQDFASAVAVDAAGNVYVAGLTTSPDFPTASALQAIHHGLSDAFVTKLSPTGALLYSTYLGGSGSDEAYALAVDGAGSAYVAGQTSSSDFPTASALQAIYHGFVDAFVTKLSPTGQSLVYSTYLGGTSTERALALAVDGAGRAVIAGYTLSADFPTANALQSSLHGSKDAFAAALDPAGAALVYSTYLGGGGDEEASALAVDGAGSAYVAGQTGSLDFPTANALQGGLQGYIDAFVTKLDPAGQPLVYSTYLGGTGYDVGAAIAVDGAGSAYVAGRTGSSDFPTANAVLGTARGGLDAFVAKLNATGTALAYSTYLGGSGDDGASALAVDGTGSAYVAGSTSSPSFPTVNAPQPAHRGSGDAFAARLAPSGSALVYSTFLGGGMDDRAYGAAVDGQGTLYLAGTTSSFDLPTVRAPFPTARAAGDAFVAVIGEYTGPSLSIADVSVTEGNAGQTDAVFTVTLSDASPDAVSVAYFTWPGSAQAYYDFVSASGTLDFPPGTTSRTFVVPVIGDTAIEPDETFTASLRAATVPLAKAIATGTILNDDVPGLSISDVAVSEGSSANAAFRVVLSPASAQTVTVQYATSDGTALAGSDYLATSGTLTFTPGRTVHSILVPIVTDAVAEGAETFTVTLSNPTGSTLARGVATGTIKDPPVGQRVRMWRAYNRTADYHFFTTSEGEFQAAVANGYTDESTGKPTFFVLNTGESGSGPVFRMYNPNAGRHYYTASAYERDSLRDVGWVYEKDEGFLFPSLEAETTEVFRLYNKNSGVHLYTADAAEKDAILATFPGIWFQHASLGYAFEQP